MKYKLSKSTPSDLSLNISENFYSNVYGNSHLDHSTSRAGRFKEIDKLLNRYTKKQAKVLDFGGGDGDLYNYLSHPYQYYLIDIAKTHMINSKLHKHNVLHFAAGWKVPTQDNFFDAVILTETLEHVHNPFNTLQEIRRILKHRGILIITVPNAFNIFYIYLSILGKYIDPSFQHVAMYDYSHLNNLVRFLDFELLDSYTKFFLFGKIYSSLFLWLDPFLSKIFKHNNMQLFCVFRVKK